MLSEWFCFRWDVQSAPLQTAHCSLVGIEDDCAGVIRHMNFLQSEVGNLPQLMATTHVAEKLIKQGMSKKVFLVPAFFRFSLATHRQFFDEEARRITDAFQLMPAEGRLRQLLMFEMSESNFNRICAIVRPTVLEKTPFP